MTNIELEKRFENIEARAAEASSLVVQEALEYSDDATQVVLSEEDFLRIMAAFPPKLVYVKVYPLAAQASMLNALGLESADGIPEALKTEVMRFMSQWIRYDGKALAGVACFVIEGVLHSFHEQVGWYAEFDEHLEALRTRAAELLAEGHKQERIAARKEASKEVKAYADKLRAHPAFSYSRPSWEKRRYLAGELFSNLEDSLLGAIVEEATNKAHIEESLRNSA